MLLKEFWEKGIDFEKIDKRYFIILMLLGIILFFPLISNYILAMNPYEVNKEQRKNDYEKEYFGTVIKKGRDKQNHNHVYFQLKDSTKIFEEEMKIWEKIAVGDSVAKKRKTKTLLIIKKDETVTVSYDAVFKYRDSLIRTCH